MIVTFVQLMFVAIQRKTKKSVVFSNSPFAIRPVLHSDSIPVPIPPYVLVGVTDECYSESSGNKSKTMIKFMSLVKNDPLYSMDKKKLNDLVRDSDLLKNSIVKYFDQN